MGLLDIDSDTLLSGLLSAGAASGAKGNYLARVAAGLATGERFKQGRQEQARQRSQDEMQAEYKQLLMQKAKFDMAQAEKAGLAETKKASELDRIDGLIRNAGQVRPGMGAGLPAGALPDDLSMPAQPALQQPGQIDYRALLQQGVPLERLKALADSGNLGRPEVARTMKGMSGGREVDQQFDKFGQPVGQGMEQFRAPVEMATGDKKSMLDPYTLKPLASFNMGQSPDSVASNATAQRGQNLTNARAVERFAFDKAGGAGTKQGIEDQKKVTDAKDVLSILGNAEGVLKNSTSSYVGAGMDQLARGIGYGTAGANAAAKLKALEGLLVSKMPKMSGPQSDKDVLLYKQMAGQIGDSTLPISTRQAAIDTIREINQRYAGEEPTKPTGSVPDWVYKNGKLVKG